MNERTQPEDRQPEDRQPAGRLPEDRPFPPEFEWLTLPMPGEATKTGVPTIDFVDRVTRAVIDDARLDRDLATLHRELPRAVLQAFAPPEPSADFVARMVAATHNDRRARWQQLLTRYVTPEPSPTFVAKTLAALTSTALAAAPSPTDGRRQTASWRERLPRPLFALAAAVLVSAALVFRALQGEADPAFEVRLARATPPAFAHAYTANSTAALFASTTPRNDPGALPDSTADGVWLLFAGTR